MGRKKRKGRERREERGAGEKRREGEGKTKNGLGEEGEERRLRGGSRECVAPGCLKFQLKSRRTGTQPGRRSLFQSELRLKFNRNGSQAS